MNRDPVETNRRGYVQPSRILPSGGPLATPSPAGGLHQNNLGNGYLSSAHNPAKRLKAYGNFNKAGMVYREGETTGYEDDGSESPFVNQASRVTAGRPPAMRAGPGMRPLFDKSNGSQGKGTPGRVAESSRGGPAKEPLVYACLWRKPQAKKHKTWDNDGILVVTGGQAELKDKENANKLVSGSIPTTATFEPDSEFSMGGREVQIQERIPYASYQSGACFTAGINLTSVPHMTQTASPSSFYGASTKKTFVPPTVARPSAYAVSSKPSVQALARTPSRHQVKEDDDDVEIMAPRVSFPTGGYNPVAQSSKTAAATNGLGRPPPVPKALHNPNATGAVVLPRPSEAHQKRWNSKHNYPVVDVVIDPILGLKLRDHQKEGIRFMYEAVLGEKTEGQGCILADEMGLGKTIQSIALIYTMLKQTPYFGDKPLVQRALIVCPVTLIRNWQKEIHKWLGRDRLGVVVATNGKNDIQNFGRNKNSSVLIIGYEKLRTVVDELKSVYPPIGLIICDEGHRLKSAGAKTTQALQSLNCLKRVILSGTPIQNELSEFHAMIDFVNPGLLDTYNTFKKIYEQPILKAREPRAKAEDKALGEARNEALNRITSLCILRRTSDIIANFLPPKSEYVVFVKPTKLQSAIYRTICINKAGDKNSKSLERSGKAGLELITLLRKVTNTPGLVLRDADADKYRDVLDGILPLFPSTAKVNTIDLSAKLLAVRTMLRILKENTDEKIVLVSSYRQTLDVLASLCQVGGFTYCRLDGETKGPERQVIVDDFNRTSQNTRMVFLLSTKAGGAGLNIIGASRLVLFDSDWNPSTDLQAMARIHRDGQKRPCFIYRLLTTGTMDEKIYQRQIKKTGLAGSLMNGPEDGKKKSGKDAFSAEDLRDIFTFHPDTACQTHDLLNCDCQTRLVSFDELDTPDLSPDASDSENESDTEPPPSRNFVKASQYESDDPREVAKANKRLQALKEWTHINCAPDESTDACENVEDELLRSMLKQNLSDIRYAQSQVFHNREHSLASDDPEYEEEQAVAAGAAKPKITYQGGEITYVFHKKTANL